MTTEDQIPRSPVTRVSVNGNKIKYIRESKGLTQLYVATFLGVTTDTVSRWENGRYPTVKWENVEKLAEALAVDPEELMDIEASDSVSGSSRNKLERKAIAAKKYVIAAVVLILAFVSLAVFFRYTWKSGTVITATRFLPRHVAPGQPFPVVVRVESTGGLPFTFIMEEMLPEDFVIVRGMPEVASFDTARNTAKWISNSRQNLFFLAYLIQTPADLKRIGKITFAGRIKADNAPTFEQRVLGDSEVEISNYHWVDTNSDGSIDDEEILTAFSSADVLKGLGVDMDLIKKIWSAGSYSWDPERNQYRINE